MRVRVTAIAAGDVTLVTGAAQGTGEETTLFDGANAIDESEITRKPLTIRVTDPIVTLVPADVDGDGEVRPLDALRILNLIGRHGAGTIEELKNRMSSSNPAAALSAENSAMDMQRFDVNRSGTITPLDALLVIDHLSRQHRLAAIATATSESAETSLAAKDVATMAASDPTLEEQIAKRRRR
jgi:hypothetical protein